MTKTRPQNVGQRFESQTVLANTIQAWLDSNPGLLLVGWKWLWDNNAGKWAKKPIVGQTGFSRANRRRPNVEVTADDFRSTDYYPGYRPGSIGRVHFDVDTEGATKAQVEAAFPGALVVRSHGGNGFHAVYRLPGDVDRWLPGGTWNHAELDGDVLCMSLYAAIGNLQSLGKLLSNTQLHPVPDNLRHLLGKRVNNGKPKPKPQTPPRREYDEPMDQRLADALQYVTGDNFDDWGTVLYAIKHELGDAGWPLFDDWSRNYAGGKYDHDENRRRWDNSEPDGRCTAGTIFHLAKQRGWKPTRQTANAPARIREPDPEPEPAPATQALDTERHRAMALDGAGMADLYPDPDNIIFWPGRKTTYLYQPATGLWLEDQDAVFASAKLSAAASDKTVPTKEGDQRPVKITNTTIRDGISEVQRQRAMASVPFDTDPHLCGTPTGVFDLRTSTARKGRRTEYVAQKLGVTPARGDTETFDYYIDWHFGHDEELLLYVLAQLASLLGGVRTDTILFFQGTGGSGKSTLVNLMAHILGSYHLKVPDRAVARTKGAHPPSHPHWLCDTRFCRAASAPELKRDHELDDGMLNDLTGSERVRAHKMRSATEEWVSNLKFILYGNHLPRVAANSGIKRRLRRIPVSRVPPREDPLLPAKLQAEAPAIAFKLADIYREHLERELDGGRFLPSTPPAVEEQSREFLSQADERLRFIEDALELTGDHENDMLSPADLQAAWSKWREDEGLPGKPSAIARWLANTTADMPNPPNRYKGTAGKRWWTGIRISGR